MHEFKVFGLEAYYLAKGINLAGVADKVGEEAADLPVVGLSEVEIAARTLAQSVALEYIEDITDEILSNTESILSSSSSANFRYRLRAEQFGVCADCFGNQARQFFGAHHNFAFHF